MLTFNVYDRVFKVRWKGATGTAFTIDIDGRQYLISAKHVFVDVETSDEIEIFIENQWLKMSITVIGIGTTTDVIVLATERPIGAHHPLRLTKGEVLISQDVFFVGYPFRMHSTVLAEDGVLPIPLVKKACLSGFFENPGGRVWVLDGFNNPGFSGGPVISAIVPKREVVFGVISSYRFYEEAVNISGKPIRATVKTNTGIIYAYSAGIAIDLIAGNPKGVEY